MSPLSIFFVFMFLLFGLMAPRNPDYNFPVSMELIILGFLHLALAFKPKAPPGYRVLFTKLEKRLFYAALFLLVVIVTPRALYSVGIYGPVPNYCKAAGMNFQIIECLMQTAINGPYCLRTLFQNYVALYIVVLTIYLFREPTPLSGEMAPVDEKKAPVGLVILSVWMTLFVLANFCLQYHGENTVMPEWLTYTVYRKRLSSIIANPGWVWPYISVGFVAATALVISKVRFFWLYGVAAAICGAGMLATQQRGALLVFVAMGIAYAVFPFIQRLMSWHGVSRKDAIRAGVGLAFAGTLVAVFLLFPQLLKQLANQVGYDFKPTNLKSARFAMWSGALSLAADAPFWGHGYASWLDAIGNYNATKSKVQVFDTAHNFYFQLLVELGLIFTLAHLALVGGIVNSWFKSQSPVGKVFALFLIAAALAVTLVQEIDYIRPTFYMFAFCVGLVFALRKMKPMSRGSSFFLFRRKYRLFPPFFLLSAGMFTIFVFNFNVYPYEFNNSEKKTLMSRWLGVTSILSTSKGLVPDKVYAYYRDHEVFHNMDFSTRSTANLPGFPMTDIPPNTTIVTGVGGILTPSRTIVDFRLGGSNGTRLITKKVGYPIVYSNTIMIPVSGFGEMEYIEDRPSLLCRSTCIVLASSCKRPAYASFLVRGLNKSSSDNIDVSYSAGKLGYPQSISLPYLRSGIVFDSPPDSVTVGGQKSIRQVEVEGWPSVSGLVPVRFSSEERGNPELGKSPGRLFYIQDGECDS